MFLEVDFWTGTLKIVQQTGYFLNLSRVFFKFGILQSMANSYLEILGSFGNFWSGQFNAVAVTCFSESTPGFSAS